uniref:chromosomal protein D1 n=1 Tax=Semicossyphus pulcher TaxID=241346 RepID=UPI0037E9A76C
MEEEIQTAEIEQGEAGNNEGESRVEMSNNSPAKRGRGRPQGSKKLKVCVTDVNLMDLVSGISNGGSTQPKRGRGRPKLSDSKHTKQQESEDSHADNPVKTHRSPGRPKGSKNKTSNKDSPVIDSSPKKRGRPKKSVTPESDAVQDLPNGGSDVPKTRRGRPKGSGKRKIESLSSGEENEGSSVPKKRGRPKGSLNKKPRLERLLGIEKGVDADGSLSGRGQRRKVKVDYSVGSIQDTSNGTLKKVHRGRGRPRKIHVQQSSDQLTKRGRGRPKGSLNKKVHGKVGRPPKVQLLPPSAKRKRGRPRKEPVKRGRPRKYPLPSPEDLKKPKVWKPLGRPRKYPRADPPEGAPAVPRRSRGRPRKSESKKGAHLRKKFSTSSSSPRSPSDGAPRKRGRPPSKAKKEGEAPKKRGRPKGSVNKNKIRSETQLESELPNHSKSKSDSSAVREAEGEEVEQNMELMPIELEDDAEETFIDQDASFEVSNQA